MAKLVAALFVLSLVAKSIAGTDVRPQESVRPFHDCLAGLESDSKQYHAWLPEEIFTADRRLYQMDLGIPALGEDLEMLKTRLATTPPTAFDAVLDRHMVDNAAAGCRTFRAAYESRAHRFLALLLCLLSMVATLTARALLIIFRRPKPEGVGANRDFSNSASEEPSDLASGSARSRRSR